MKRPYRVKLVLPGSSDAHYFYADTFDRAKVMRDTLTGELPRELEFSVFIYVDTSLGHIRVA